jgi:hypothetical protein
MIHYLKRLWLNTLMETAITFIVFIHLIGMAGLVGGSLAQVRSPERKATSLMRDGALTQLVTGIILVGLVQANNEILRQAIVGAKSVILIVILILVFTGRKKLTNGAFFAILLLSVINVALALFINAPAA